MQKHVRQLRYNYYDMQLMRVFTHYREISGENSDGFRFRTLLQFGSSWDIVGSVVMKNPGSANFKSPEPIKDEELLSPLMKFDDGQNDDSWYEFKADNTMRCIASMFTEYFQRNTSRPLEGVVQIFNLFYIKDVNLHAGLDKLQRVGNLDIIDFDIAHLKAPIYFGFSNLGKAPKLRENAERFFNKALKQGMRNKDANFFKNKFPHPLYLMLYGKNREDIKMERLKFYQNTLTPTK